MPFEQEIVALPGCSFTQKHSLKAIVFTPEVTLDTILKVLGILRMYKVEFYLYDPLYPSPSDPGAFISYSQDKKQPDADWGMTLGNHGWSGGIYSLNEMTIAYQIHNLVLKNEIDSIRIEKVCFFRHYSIKDFDLNKKQTDLLNSLHQP